MTPCGDTTSAGIPGISATIRDDTTTHTTTRFAWLVRSILILPLFHAAE